MKPSERLRKFMVGDIQPFPDGRTNDICRIADKINDIIQYLDEVYETEETARKELKDKLVDMD